MDAIIKLFDSICEIQISSFIFQVFYKYTKAKTDMFLILNLQWTNKIFMFDELHLTNII